MSRCFNAKEITNLFPITNVLIIGNGVFKIAKQTYRAMITEDKNIKPVIAREYG